MLEIALIIGGVVVDQLSKMVFTNMLQFPGTTQLLIPGFLNLTYVKNYGAAFGILQNMQWLLAIVALLVCGVGAFYLLRNRNNPMLVRLSISLIIAGGLGNLIDRAVLGYVRDFFEFAFVRFYIFNVADIFVTVGAALLIIYLVFLERRRGKPTIVARDGVKDGGENGQA
ncbi:MAG: signal peptidase II [Christensenellales bacterium]|jgi:signal peptidase II